VCRSSRSSPSWLPRKPDSLDETKTVVPTRHDAGMEQPKTAASPRRIERSVTEARIQLAQLIRMISMTGEVVHIVDGGRPVAAIVADDTAQSRAEVAAGRDRTRAAAAGWEHRVEQVRATAGRQQAVRIRVLEQLLREAWRLLDDRHPPGTDRAVDGVRTAYRETACQRSS
jgi:antitoxin (DNA-binding transcriptional repressor) of toxin-antitoxin stability system